MVSGRLLVFVNRACKTHTHKHYRHIALLKFSLLIRYSGQGSGKCVCVCAPWSNHNPLHIARKTDQTDAIDAM